MVRCTYKRATFNETKQLLSLDDIDSILFKEKLYVFDENGKRSGRFSLNIDTEDSPNYSQKILHVHISNRAFIKGKLSETLVTGTVTNKLKTLEEIRYEATEVSNNSGKQERTMFLLRETTKYYLSVTNSICDIKYHHHKTIPFGEALIFITICNGTSTGEFNFHTGSRFGLIGESSNAILIRNIGLKGYEGILCLRTILSNGKRCRSYYVSRVSEQKINGKRMKVLIIYRNITNHGKYNLTMTMAVTKAGQLVYLFWSNSKFFLHIDPDVELIPNQFVYGAPKLHKFWHKDIQLYSIYLDRVDQQKIYCKSYKYQRESLKRLLNDFVLSVLLMKPQDVICYAISYFTAFNHETHIKCQPKSKLPPVVFEEVAAEEKPEEFEELHFSGENDYSFFGEDIF